MCIIRRFFFVFTDAWRAELEAAFGPGEAAPPGPGGAAGQAEQGASSDGVVKEEAGAESGRVSPGPPTLVSVASTSMGQPLTVNPLEVVDAVGETPPASFMEDEYDGGTTAHVPLSAIQPRDVGANLEESDMELQESSSHGPQVFGNSNYSP